jgi:hypothetical protein
MLSDTAQAHTEPRTGFEKAPHSEKAEMKTALLPTLILAILLVLVTIRRIGTAVKTEHPFIGFLLRLLFWNTFMVVLLVAITARWPATLNLTAQNWPWGLWWFRFLDIYLKLVALGVGLALVGFPVMFIAKEFRLPPGQRFRLERNVKTPSLNA